MVFEIGVFASHKPHIENHEKAMKRLPNNHILPENHHETNFLPKEYKLSAKGENLSNSFSYYYFQAQLWECMLLFFLKPHASQL